MVFTFLIFPVTGNGNEKLNQNNDNFRKYLKWGDIGG